MVYFFVKNNQNLWYFRPDGKVSDRPPAYKNGIEGLDWEWGERKGKPVKLSLWQGFKYWFEPQYEPFKTESNAERPRMGQGNQTKYKQKRKEVKPIGIIGEHGKRGQTAGPLPNNNPLGRNKRTVWTIPTQAEPEAHFATFPDKLVEPMIKAGCPEFVCKKCGKAREKIYEQVKHSPVEIYTGQAVKDYDTAKAQNPSDTKRRVLESMRTENKPIGYTDCGCKAEWRPGICLDMFLRDRHSRQGIRPVAA